MCLSECSRVAVCVCMSFVCVCMPTSCILGELFVKKPLFQANQEILQLETIRSVGVCVWWEGGGVSVVGMWVCGGRGSDYQLIS